MDRFCTGSTRPPSGGFALLQGQMGVHRKFALVIVELEYPGQLPSSSTCFNRLYLPAYTSQAELDRCLLTAMEFAAVGFQELP